MTFSRQQFCGTLGAGLALANMDLFADEPKPKPLRVIAYNIFKLTGWPSDRPLAKQAVAKGQMAKRLAMELALHDPDIINFSESPNEELTKEVAELLGMNHVRLPSGGIWPDTRLWKSNQTERFTSPVFANSNLTIGYVSDTDLARATGVRLVIHDRQSTSKAMSFLRVGKNAWMARQFYRQQAGTNRIGCQWQVSFNRNHGHHLAAKSLRTSDQAFTQCRSGHEGDNC